jgi:N-acetyltransferase
MSYTGRMDLQPTLSCELLKLVPLRPDDFEMLFAVAADPLVWAQHPNPDRHQRAVFENFFDGAVASGGAFVVLDANTGAVIGSTRFYGHDPAARTVHVGYTFLARSHWGGRFNPAMKRLMLNHAFRFVDTVLFHIGVDNRRSRIAIERLGATVRRELEVAYHGEPIRHNVEYAISRDVWTRRPGAACV